MEENKNKKTEDNKTEVDKLQVRAEILKVMDEKQLSAAEKIMAALNRKKQE